MFKDFIRTIFVKSCIACCFGIVSDIALCVCYPGTKNYFLLCCPLSGFDILCIVVVEWVGLSFGKFWWLLCFTNFLWVVIPWKQSDGRITCFTWGVQIFLPAILSLLILFIEKLTCPSSISWSPFLFIKVIISDLNSVNLVLVNAEIELIKSLLWGFSE